MFQTALGPHEITAEFHGQLPVGPHKITGRLLGRCLENIIYYVSSTAILALAISVISVRTSTSCPCPI
jgi:hypothetical protein